MMRDNQTDDAISGVLSEAERIFLHQTMIPVAGLRTSSAMRGLSDILAPAHRALAEYQFACRHAKNAVLHAVMSGALDFGTTPSSWSVAEWTRVVHRFGKDQKLALIVTAVRGYGVNLRQGIDLLYPDVQRVSLARRLYGRAIVDAECTRIRNVLNIIGYSINVRERLLNLCVAELLIWHDCPNLNSVTDATLADFTPSAGAAKAFRRVTTALIQLQTLGTHPIQGKSATEEDRRKFLGVSEEWIQWCERWRRASINSKRTCRSSFSELMTAGRWLARDHPTITSPADWNMDLALEYARFVSQKCVGDDLAVPRLLPRMGEQLSAGSKLGLLTTVRCFFHDLHQWEWISRSFNPDRGFAAPRQLTRARHVNPRPIDDAYWLKLRAASLTLQPADLPNNGRARGFPYPFELTQAVATTWTFSGCRANEIERLEVGCVHIEHVPEQINTSTGQIEPAFTQPMLRVPVNKTRGEFIKPIEEPMAQAIATWELVRPAQARVIDPTTGQLAGYLFCYRGVRIGRGFINDTIIPLLLRKANLPSHDSRGKITSHRGRATLATKLYNNSSGLTSLEIMTWLGHAKLSSGQHYIELTPKRLITSFHRSAKLTENIRSVSVLVDRYAEPGTPVFRYDMGHGWCTNDAYASCAHRMACAKCMFYEPAESFGKALAAQSDRYVHMLQELTLTDDERAAVTGDEEAIRKLLFRLAAEPVPAVA